MANSPSGDSVLDRVMRVLTVLEAEPELSPNSLARETGLPKSTAYRLIDDLARRGLLERGPEGQISLGQRLWEMAQRTPLATTLRRTALPHMEDLNGVVQHTTQLTVLDGPSVMVVEQLSRTAAAENTAEAADRMPAHLTSMGHAILAFSAPTVVDDLLSRRGGRIAAERPTFRAELAEARRRGYAQLTSAVDRRTLDISAPVLDEQGRALAALTVVAPSDAMNPRRHLAALTMAARGLSADLSRQKRSADCGPQGAAQPVAA